MASPPQSEGGSNKPKRGRMNRFMVRITFGKQGHIQWTSHDGKDDKYPLPTRLIVAKELEAIAKIIRESEAYHQNADKLSASLAASRHARRTER